MYNNYIMNFEKQFENNQKVESGLEKAEKIIKNVIEQLKANPEYSSNANKKAEIIEDKWKKLKASAKNGRANNQIKEFIQNGLAEELYKTEEFDPSDPDVYVSYMENGYRINNNPVYGDHEDEIISQRYIKTPVSPNPEQIAISNEINTRYEEESHKSFANSWKIKEALFDEQIEKGEMVFLGEMAFDDYIKMRKDNAPEAHEIKYELTPVFDENEITWSKDNNKIYAYTGIKPEQPTEEIENI